MQSFIVRGLEILREFPARFRGRRDTAAIDTADALSAFASSRAAFVAQKKLYGYLKTRMGTRYPSMFEDDVFVASINIAKMHVFAACLSDISVHAAGRVLAGAGQEADPSGLALDAFHRGLADNAAAAQEEADIAGWLSGFRARLDAADWPSIAAGADCFTESPSALVRWAPIADEHKRYDREIVENSIRFAWAEFTRDLRKRLDAPAVARDWAARG